MNKPHLRPTSAELVVSNSSAAVPQTRDRSADDPFLSMIERAARDPDTDVVKMERLFDMAEKMRRERARLEYVSAFADLVPDLPTIQRNGTIIVYSKADREKPGGPQPNDRPIQQTPYATFDDILEALNPVLARHGFSLRFEWETDRVGESFRIVTRAVLQHTSGHVESATTPPLQQDSSGSKNNVQGVGSALTYGKRYAMRGVLPIVSHAPQDKDDDGVRSGVDEPKLLTDEQLDRIKSLLIQTDSNIDKFYAVFKVQRVEDLTETKARVALQMLEDKMKGAKSANDPQN